MELTILALLIVSVAGLANVFLTIANFFAFLSYWIARLAKKIYDAETKHFTRKYEMHMKDLERMEASK